MTRPQYITDLSNVYTEMYHPAGRERPLTEQQVKDIHGQEEEHDYDIPKWKKLLNQHAEGERFKRPPHSAHHEAPVKVEEENEDIGVGSDLVGDYLDALEKKNILDDLDHGGGDLAQEYLKTVIDKIPTAVGGVNIHSEIKKAFIAGTKAN